MPASQVSCHQRHHNYFLSASIVLAGAAPLVSSTILLKLYLPEFEGARGTLAVLLAFGWGVLVYLSVPRAVGYLKLYGLPLGQEALLKRLPEPTNEGEPQENGRSADLDLRRLAQKALSHLAAIVTTSGDAILSLTPEGKITTWNKAAEKLFGYSPEEIIGQTVFRLVPLGSGDELQKLLRKVRAGETLETFETMRMKKDGTHFNISLTLSAILDESSQVAGISWIARDTSQFVESQALVRKLSSVVEQTDDLVLITQIDGSIEYVNPAFLKLTGYSSAEVIGQTPRILKSGKQSPEFYHDLWETILHGESYRNIIINRKKDGTFFYTEKTITPLKDEHGSILRFVSTDKDITGRRLAEECHAKALRRFQEIFNFSKDGMAYKGLDGRLIDVNPAYCSITGYSKEELVAKKHYHDLTPQEYHSTEDQIMKDVISGGEPVEYEKEYLHKNGYRVPVLLTVFSVVEKGNGNTVSAVVTIIKNISERKQGEKELNKKTVELERSNEELERFASLASHDLQEPLRTIATHLQLVERSCKEKLNKDTLESLHFAVDGAKRMKALIDDILVYSKAGSVRRRLEDTDSREVVHEVLGRISDSIKESQGKVIVGVLPRVVADRGQLSQVFQNLVSNALKYCSNSPPRIEIGGTSDENDNYKFWVKDNGLGIPADQQNKIFMMFQRLHSIAEYPGTGIGLATCKKIVENHGGKIWVESAAGEGSTFYFTLGKGAAPTP